jgi:hypothetical protein
MNSRITISVVALLCILIATAGCTGAPAAPTTPAAGTPAPAAPPAVTGTPDSATTGSSMVPSPTDSVGDARTVMVLVDKDYLGNVHTTFQGGPGLLHVKKIDVTLNRADGQVKTATVGNKVDDTAVLEGTKNTDRCIVFVTLDDGKAYRIYDQLVAFKPRV